MTYIIKTRIAELVNITQTRLNRFLSGADNLTPEELDKLEEAISKPCQEAGEVRERINLAKQRLELDNQIKSLTV